MVTLFLHNTVHETNETRHAMIAFTKPLSFRPAAPFHPGGIPSGTEVCCMIAVPTVICPASSVTVNVDTVG